jgi:galactose mutarotase-like enzyme
LKQIEIKKKNSRAIVSSVGGTVVEFVHQDTDIVYPQTIVKKRGEMKNRGGIPICFPFFGPPKPGFRRLGQHGWLRNEELAVVSTSRNSVVFEGENRYRKTYPWRVRYRVTVSMIEDGLLETKLRVTRKKDGVVSKAPINPAFHPYFASSFEDRARIVDIDTSNHLFSAGIEVHPNGRARILPAPDGILINLGLKTVRMSLGGDFSRGSCLVLWSDSGKYFCVEPVLGDPDSFNTPNGIYLKEKEWLTIVCLLRVVA